MYLKKGKVRKKKEKNQIKTRANCFVIIARHEQKFFPARSHVYFE